MTLLSSRGEGPGNAQAQEGAGKESALPARLLEPARAAPQHTEWPHVSAPWAVLFYCPSLVINSTLSCLMWAARCRCPTQGSDCGH